MGLPTPHVVCGVQRCPCSRHSSTNSKPRERCGAIALRKPYPRLRTRGGGFPAHNRSCRCGRRVRPRATCSPHTTNLTHGGSPPPPPLLRAAWWPPWRCGAAHGGRRYERHSHGRCGGQRTYRTSTLSLSLLATSAAAVTPPYDHELTAPRARECECETCECESLTVCCVQVLGWGGAFTGAAAANFWRLSDAQRQQVCVQSPLVAGVMVPRDVRRASRHLIALLLAVLCGTAPRYAGAASVLG